MANIAVVVLDTLRRDAFEEHFNWLPGTRYEHAYSPSHYTIPAHAGLFTGKYASEVGVHAKSEILDCSTPVLPERLQEAGYTTRAFTANVLLSPWNNWDRGFDAVELGWRVRAAAPETFNWTEELSELSDAGRIERHCRAVWKCICSSSPTLPSLDVGWRLKRADHDGAPEALQYVSKTSFHDDEFLFMNLMEAHSPYDPPAEYQSVDLGEFEDTSTSLLGGETDCSLLQQAYDDSVRYLSDMYRQIFEELCTDFDFIITVSDHGELFGEHGARSHWHGVYPELTHIPMSIWDGESVVEYRDEVVSLLDIHQTVLSIAGDETTNSRGRDIRGAFDETVWLTEYLGLRPSRIAALEEDGFRTTTIDQYDSPLFGLAADSYYGWETVGGYEECGHTTIEDPQIRLRDERDNRDVQPLSEVSEADLDSNTREQLEKLGYV